jgi:hypothetical protein
MKTYTFFEYLLELVQETTNELIKIYYDKPNRKTLLKFPKYKNGKIRVSEQELRFALTNLHGKFAHPGLYYTVETPTDEEYSFSGNGKRSAASDISFYAQNNEKLNIELKAHMPEQSAVDKDIEKLFKENAYGAWIHIFENEDKGTVKNLFKKFEIAIKKYGHPKKPISFHIIILKKGILLSRKGRDNEIDYSKIFNIEYSMWNKLKYGKYQYRNGKPTTVKEPNEDWQIDVFHTEQ